ncbi:MAG TPA: hypothetical protein VF066_01100 [Thermoleophilaceae bacterium]
MAERLTIVVAGGAGAMPFAGVVWQVLHYLEGFRRLGHDVFYLEDTGSWPYDPVRDTVSDDAGPAIEFVRRAVERIGLEGSWGYRNAVDGSLHGTSEQHLADVLARADVLANVTGVTVLGEALASIPARFYVETDPVLPEIEIAKGNERTAEWLGAHTHVFTYGENFGADDCPIPLPDFKYHATRQPVVLDWWQPAAPGSSRPHFTTVANWKQTAKDIEWEGEVWTWSKDIQWRPYMDLPGRVRRPLELALAVEDDAAVAELERSGWHVVPALPMTKDIDEYRDYLAASAGEFSVAKEQYARSRSGWFSDRTACYLALGKPAIVQDTRSPLPAGEGLLTFNSVDQAVAAFEEIDADYERHSRAARALAVEYLSAEVVLARMLADAGLT